MYESLLIRCYDNIGSHTNQRKREKKSLCVFLTNSQHTEQRGKKSLRNGMKKKIIKLFSSLRLCDIRMLSIAGAFYTLSIYSYNNNHLYASFWEHRRDVEKRIWIIGWRLYPKNMFNNNNNNEKGRMKMLKKKRQKMWIMYT